MVIITRLKSSGLNMSITAEVREYFDNLIKPLVTNKSLEELLYKFKEGIISKFEDKLREQNLKIQELESKIHSQENAFKRLERISDNNKHYSRRSCLRIHGIEFKEGDSGDVLEEIEKCYNVVGIPFYENEIDRVNGIGKPFLERKKKVRSIIVKFKPWKARDAFFKARPKHYVNGRKKPGLTLFSVSLDLIKHRCLLLAKTKSIIKDNPAIMFAFTDINCSLALKLNDDKFHHFNSEDELNKTLQKC